MAHLPLLRVRSLNYSMRCIRVSNNYDQPQLPPTKMATAENGEPKQSRISGKPDRALCPYDTDMSVSYHTMYFSYDHVF